MGRNLIRKVSGFGRDIPQGTLALFQQTAAPVGWTKETTHNNKALRVVTGTASSAGATAFATVFGSGKTADNHTLVTAEYPADAIRVDGAGGLAATGAGSAWRNSGVGGGAHSHTLSLDLQYVDLIIARKD